MQTPRLRLRPLTTTDLDRIHELWTEPGVRKFLLDDKIVTRDFVADAIAKSQRLFDKQRFGLWGFSFSRKADLIGFGGFWYFRDPPELELLYGLTTAHWGKGLATEAATALIRYGFEVLRFDRIQACADAGNLTSQRVIGKTGMRFIKRGLVDGLDLLFYEIEQAEFKAGRADN